MKYIVSVTFSIFSLFSFSQDLDSLLIVLEEEFVQYDLPNSDTSYYDSTYKTLNTTTGFIGGLGYNDGPVIEIGYGKAYKDIIGKKTSFQSYYGGVEILPITNYNFMIAPKAAIWIEEATYFTAFGANLLYFTDFNGYSFRLRPEIGIGLKSLKITYGYNLPLVKGNLVGLNEHQFGVSYFFEHKLKNTVKTTYRQFLEEQKEDFKNGNW